MSQDVKETVSESHFPGRIVGAFWHALDPKFRLTVPSSWRASLGEVASLYVMPDADDTFLRVMPPGALDKLMGLAEKHVLRDRQKGAALRTLFSNLEQVDLDVQGRIRISDRLLAFAGLGGTVALVGCGKWFEVWSSARKPEPKKVPQDDIGDAIDDLDALFK